MKSLINQILEKAASDKAEVCKLLNWTEMEYAEFQYSCGKQYLQYYVASDPAGIDELISSKIYWNWWKLMWSRRDFAYLHENLNQLSLLYVENRVKLYKHLHDPFILSQATTPPGFVLEESYSKMIDNVIKEAV